MKKLNMILDDDKCRQMVETDFTETEQALILACQMDPDLEQKYEDFCSLLRTLGYSLTLDYAHGNKNLYTLNHSFRCRTEVFAMVVDETKHQAAYMLYHATARRFDEIGWSFIEEYHECDMTDPPVLDDIEGGLGSLRSAWRDAFQKGDFHLADLIWGQMDNVHQAIMEAEWEIEQATRPKRAA